MPTVACRVRKSFSSSSSPTEGSRTCADEEGERTKQRDEQEAVVRHRLEAECAKLKRKHEKEKLLFEQVRNSNILRSVCVIMT